MSDGSWRPGRLLDENPPPRAETPPPEPPATVGGRLGLRVPPELHERLTAEAHARRLNLNYFVTKLLEEGLDRLIPADEFTLTRRRTDA